MTIRKTIQFQSVVRIIESIIFSSRGIAMLIIGMYLTVSPFNTIAQQSNFQAGDQVANYIPSMQKKPIIGILNEIDINGMMLHDVDSTSFISHSSISNLSVSTGKQSRMLKGATLGLVGGAVIGGTIGFISYKECAEEGLLGCFLTPETRGEAFLQGALIGALPGALIGVAIVSAMKDNTWEKIPDRVLLGVKPTGILQPDSKPHLTFHWSIGSRN